MTAFGYIRKSVVADASTTLSPQVQRERIEALARAKGDDVIQIIEDLDVSGFKVAERAGYMRLVEAVKSGEASSVYAYDLSRLHRNVREQLAFFEMCDAQRVPVRLVAESIDTSGATGKLMLTVIAAMNEWVSRVTSEKIRASFARKRATGWKPGAHEYGSKSEHDAQAVVDTFRETGGNYLRTARLLNERDVPTRNGKSRGWSPAAVRAVVSRLAPDAMAERRTEVKIKGSRTGPRDHRFARLLRCSVCGAIMTPSKAMKYGRAYVGYYCHGYYKNPPSGQPQHGRKMISERQVLPLVRAEMEHAQFESKRARKGSAEDAMEAATLEGKRARYKEMYGEGLIDKPTRDAKLSEIDESESKLSAMRWVRTTRIPPDVENDAPQKVNEYLRRVLVEAVVDMASAGRTIPAMTFTWRDPEMRVENVEDDAA